jgi:hypothetical protein
MASSLEDSIISPRFTTFNKTKPKQAKHHEKLTPEARMFLDHVIMLLDSALR